MTCGYLPMGLCMIHPLAAVAEQLNEARTRMGCAATSSHDPRRRGFAPSSQLRGRARVSSNDLSVQGRAWLLFKDRQHTGKVGPLSRLRRFPTVIPSLNKPAKLPILSLAWR